MTNDIAVLEGNHERSDLPIGGRDVLMVVLWYVAMTVVIGFGAALVAGVILGLSDPNVTPDRIEAATGDNFAFVVATTTLSAAIMLWVIRRQLCRHSARPFAQFFPAVGTAAIAWAALAALVLAAAGIAAETALSDVYGITVESSAVENAMVPKTPIQLGIIVVCFVLFVPFFEEVMFRGVILGWLRRIGPAWLAIVLSAAAFAAVHGLFVLRGGISGWVGTAEIFLIGALAAFLVVRTGSLWPAWVVHIVNNALAFVLNYLAATH